MRTLYLLLIAAVLTCGQALAATDPTIWFPLSEGCSWVMDAKMVAPNGSIVPGIAHRVVEGQVERYGKTYHRVRTWMESTAAAKNVVTKLTRMDATGVYTIEESEKGATEEREVVFPLMANQSWKRRGGALKDVILGLENITIGDTTYENCLHIRTTTPDAKFSENYWVAPNVGNVKSVMSFANGAKIILTLREFSPGK
ncbi:MAG TPA: hypothetical protein VGM54_14980 [Chthoniobacter sp.]|jgi:hypothetical protein